MNTTARLYFLLAILGIFPICLFYSYATSTNLSQVLVISLSCYSFCFWANILLEKCVQKVCKRTYNFAPYFQPLQSLIFLPLALPISYAFAAKIWPPVSSEGSSWISGVFLSFACIGLISLWSFSLHSQMKAKQFELDLLKSRLFGLNSQMNPHFIFNSFNGLAGLIENDTHLAKNLILDISDFFRFFLRASNLDFHPLKSEIELTKTYLEIEKSRFPHLNITWNIDSKTLQFKVPTLILQPLLENAIKYGSGKIKISVTKNSRFLIISVENAISKEKTIHNSTGLGLKNLEERLSLLLKNKGSLSTQQLDMEFQAQIKLNIGARNNENSHSR